MKSVIEFPHRQSAHCESGVTANLLSFHGIACSEAMVFGIGEGLFFGYLPFIRVNKLPLTTYRGPVGSILGKTMKRLGVELVRQKFKDPNEAMAALDRLLAQGVPVGCQTGAYWLPYFPPAFRFHFNMHNLVVVGKEGNDYLISDPVFEQVVRCAGDDLVRARFAKGALAPQGAMYHVSATTPGVDLQQAARQGLSGVCRTMVKTPIFFLGTRGINFLAGRLAKWPQRLGEEKAILHLGQLIRMQEEIGTGGGGFRFIFAAFLQEAAQQLAMDELNRCSERMTEIGDLLRQFALRGARICKNRRKEGDSFAELADLLRLWSARERELYQDIAQLLAQK